MDGFVDVDGVLARDDVVHGRALARVLLLLRGRHLKGGRVRGGEGRTGAVVDGDEGRRVNLGEDSGLQTCVGEVGALVRV